jgi:NAD-dependent DNA ligase
MDKKYKRFLSIGWELLEHKYRYYVLDNPTIPDHEYDILEKEYDNLAKELDLEPTASNMVGFDTKRPCCQLVISKIRKVPLYGIVR